MVLTSFKTLTSQYRFGRFRRNYILEHDIENLKDKQIEILGAIKEYKDDKNRRALELAEQQRPSVNIDWSVLDRFAEQVIRMEE